MDIANSSACTEDTSLEAGSDADFVVSQSPRAAKSRKISYVPEKCYLCDSMNNPKKMTTLSGPTKDRQRETACFLKQADGLEFVEIVNGAKLCKGCLQRVFKVINSCFVCGEIVKDPRLIRILSDGRFKELAIEERLCFQGARSKRATADLDRVCLCCQKRINHIIEEETCGNSIKMKVVLQRSKKACIVCCDTKNLKDVPRNARIEVFIKTGLFILQGSKSCSHHFVGDTLILSLCEGFISIDRQITLDPSEVVYWLNSLRAEIICPKKKRYNDIDSFEDCDLVALTSLTKLYFEDLFSYIQSYRDINRAKCHKVDLLCFLAKMRQGLSDEFLRAMFGYSSRQSVSAAISRIRRALIDGFVPKYLGLQAISREELIEHHVPDYAQKLYNSCTEKKVVLIIDGTYIYIPKSSNYRVMRQTFCVHKGAHLVKPIMVVLPDGWILDVHGPYFSDGKNNDAECLRDALKDVNGLKDYLEPMDVILVDKGYDRVVQQLEEDHDLSVFMPKFLGKRKKQFSTEEANSTRIVTCSRWVVEARNGHMKSKFGMFRSTIHMQHVKNVGDFFRIGCAIINAYCGPIKMNHATEEWAQDMIAQSQKQNKLRKFVDENKLQGQRKNWETMNAQSLPEFPQLSYDYLRKLTFGVYQIKLARSYVQDKIQNENQYNFKIHKQRPGLIRVQTKSRFSGSKRRNLWILYNDPLLSHDEQLYDKDNIGPILGWCCDCPNGARSLGCCAHVVSVLWYLGLARHQSNVFPSNELLSALKDCSERSIPVINLNGVPISDDDEYIDFRPDIIEVEMENGQLYFDEVESEEMDIRDSFVFADHDMEQSEEMTDDEL